MRTTSRAVWVAPLPRAGRCFIPCAPPTAAPSAAHNALTVTQRTRLSRHAHLLPLPIPTLETIGGGSVRCLLAEVFLPARIPAG